MIGDHVFSTDSRHSYGYLLADLFLYSYVSVSMFLILSCICSKETEKGYRSDHRH